MKKSYLHIGVLVLQLLLRNGFFDLFGINDPILWGLRLRDLSFIAALMWVIYVEFVYKGWKVSSTFSRLVRVFLGLILLSCFVSYCKFGQPLHLGFQNLRDIFAGFSLFLAINTLVYRGVLTQKQVLNTVFAFGLAQLLTNSVCWILYVMTGTTMFSGATIATSRYGEARIIFSQCDNIALIMAISLNEILNKRKFIFHGGVLLWGLANYMIMEKMRAASVAIIFAIALTIMVWRKASVNKLVIAVMMVVMAVVACYRIPLLQDLVQTFFYANSTSENTMIARGAARTYYLKQFLKSPIFGWGSTHASWESAVAQQGFTLGYYLADNGVFSFMYIFGSIGLIWLAAIMVVYLRRAKAMNTMGCYIFTTWAGFQTVMLITGMGWITSNYQIPFVIALVLATEYYDVSSYNIEVFYS